MPAPSRPPARSRRRRFVPVLLAALVLLATASSCCFTRHVWEVADTTPEVAFAVVATPFTLVLDVIRGPVWFVWVIATAGGHGDPWLECP